VTLLTGWAADPYGEHQGRYFSEGRPTNRVRDGNRFFFDDPPVDPSVAPGTPATDPPSDGDVRLGPEAAWYPDPTDPNVVRYWDGSHWTGDVAPLVAPPPAPPAAEAQAEEHEEHEEEEQKEHPMPHVAPPDGATTAAPPTPAGPLAAAPPAPALRLPGTAPSPPAKPSAPEQPASAAPEATTQTAEPTGEVSADTGRLVVHAAHYVVAPADDSSESPESAGPSSPEHAITIVTGQVPTPYNRITVECEHGEVVEAQILEPRAIAGFAFFAALVRSRVVRVVATKSGGVYGIFLDVELQQSRTGTTAPQGNR